MAEFRARYMSEIRQKIPGISDAQVAAIANILDETKKKFDDIRRDERPKRDQIQQEQIDAIRATLTEAQRPAYEAWRTERQKAQQGQKQNRAKSVSATGE
jgi:DNA anti-recombination protein RmuC